MFYFYYCYLVTDTLKIAGERRSNWDNTQVPGLNQTLTGLNDMCNIGLYLKFLDQQWLELLERNALSFFVKFVKEVC